jgi:hypothetical protein
MVPRAWDEYIDKHGGGIVLYEKDVLGSDPLKSLIRKGIPVCVDFFLVFYVEEEDREQK